MAQSPLSPAASPVATPASPALEIPQTNSQPSSGGSSPRSHRSNLSLDLSNIPPLTKPSPPTNTLLITNLSNPEIFKPDHLQSLRALIDQSAPIHSWSPLKSFRRIVTSFETEEDAIRVRSILDGEAIMGERVRVYFGNHTPINPVDQHLHAPESKKLFFISPPPSPPHGWEMRNEGPPNSVVMADDLHQALTKLTWNRADCVASITPDEDKPENLGRTRSGSTVIFEPESDSKHEMPGITVDDFSDNESSPVSGAPSPIPDSIKARAPLPHTSRPPVETMQDA